MRDTVSAPSVVPSSDENVYLVLDDFGKLGRAYREADEDASDLATVISDLMAGAYTGPVRVVAFNTAEGWAADVSSDVAREVRDRTDDFGCLPEGVRQFVERQLDVEVKPC